MTRKAIAAMRKRRDFAVLISRAAIAVNKIALYLTADWQGGECGEQDRLEPDGAETE